MPTRDQVGGGELPLQRMAICVGEEVVGEINGCLGTVVDFYVIGSITKIVSDRLGIAGHELGDD